MKILNIFLICLLAVQVIGYSLPGDKQWPSSLNFLELKNKIIGKVAFRGYFDYLSILHTWNTRTNVPKPAVIVQPSNPQDIIEALKFARNYNIRISVMSTGHHQDVRNIYDNSVHIDMSTMNSKSIDIQNKRLTVGPGNNFSQIHKFVAYETNGTLAAMGGADPGVGPYGWTVGGGHGALTRLYGFGADNLVSMDIILANYTIVTASETQNQDLFRALRGSGGSAFGIGISLTVKLFETPGPVSSFLGIYELSNNTAEMFGNWMISAPDRAFSYFLPTNLGENPFVSIIAQCFGNESFCSPVLTELKVGCLPIAAGICEPGFEYYKSYFEFTSSLQSERGGSVYLTSTSLNSTNIIPALKETLTFLLKYKGTGCSGNAVLGGVSSTIDLDQTKTTISPAMRQSLMALTCYFGTSGSSNNITYQASVMDNLGENIFKKYNKWVYWNEPQHNFPSDDWKERYWGGLESYNKLLVVKQKYDPDNVFSCYHCIGYVKEPNDVPAVCPQDSCSCTNSDGQCSYVPNVEWGKIVYTCNFDESTICNGKITYHSTNGQQLGLLQSSNTSATQLGYDITDITSINSLTSINQTCQIPFDFNSRSNSFCAKINNDYKCKTNPDYTSCNLGKFLGGRITMPTGVFDMSWETNIPAQLPRAGNYSLQFYVFYNCYQTKSLWDFFASDCNDVLDRATLYTKNNPNDIYTVVYIKDLRKGGNVNNKWEFNQLNIYSNSNNLYIKVKFERLFGASKGEAVFGIDNISLVDQSI